MDTELARTFLSVVSAGNFISAAERMNVTQSTVSARIQTLERQLGCRLFVRNKGGTTLTPEGRQFQKHASTLVRTVEQARQDVGIPRGFRGALTVGGRIGLWDAFLLRWVPRFRTAAPDILVRAEIEFEPALMQGLVEGRIDIGVMYTPQRRPGLIVEALFDDILVLLSGAPDPDPALDRDYVYIDWGPEFFAKHSASFPDYAPSLTTNIGWFGIRHILENRGSAYLPIRMARAHIEAGRMVPVKGVPEFRLPAYMIHREDGDARVMDGALDTLRRIAAEEMPLGAVVGRR